MAVIDAQRLPHDHPVGGVLGLLLQEGGAEAEREILAVRRSTASLRRQRAEQGVLAAHERRRPPATARHRAERRGTRLRGGLEGRSGDGARRFGRRGLRGSTCGGRTRLRRAARCGLRRITTEAVGSACADGRSEAAAGAEGEGAAGGGGTAIVRGEATAETGEPVSLRAARCGSGAPLIEPSRAGRAALISASSRRVRASAPARTASSASPSSSSRRTTVACGTRSACSARAASDSGVSDSSPGTSPSVWTIISSRARPSRSVAKEVASRPCSKHSSSALSARFGSAVGDRVDRLGEQPRVGHTEHREDVVEGDHGAAVGDELLERAEGVAEAAGGGAGHRRDGGRRDLDRLGRRDARRRRSRSASTVGRWKSKRWQRSTTVAGTLLASVVASTKTVLGGGSSSVFRKAFQAAVESMCASSRM